MSNTIYSRNNKYNLQNGKRLLDVYYYIDFDDDVIDLKILEKCLNINIKVNVLEYDLNRFVNCNNKYINTEKIGNNDVIKRGLLIFNKIFKKLKVYTSNDIWFVYISNGNITDGNENVFITLINKNPWIKTCSYSIYKKSIFVNKYDGNGEKLSKLHYVNETLKRLLFSNKTITYTNLEE